MSDEVMRRGLRLFVLANGAGADRETLEAVIRVAKAALEELEELDETSVLGRRLAICRRPTPFVIAPHGHAYSHVATKALPARHARVLLTYACGMSVNLSLETVEQGLEEASKLGLDAERLDYEPYACPACVGWQTNREIYSRSEA